jgi:hypothetical protein
MTDADRIRCALTMIGWSQNQLGRVLCVSQRRARYWCSGREDVPVEVLNWLGYLATAHFDNPPPVVE